MPAMNDQVDKGIDEAKDLTAAAGETAADLARKAQRATGQGVETIRDTARETTVQISDAAATAYRQGTQAADYVSQRTTEQPLLALLLAGAIGYGIAYLIHTR
jgi:ElaB/YqjD/DUF883 family membrane-anchored ribosome-binding protein